jgi:uncharacterized protein YndB with AHSA1/START domain
MKFLKYLFYIILGLVIIFIGRVLLTPSVSYENEILVDKSVKESWAVMSDELTMPKWIKGFQRSELVSGTKNTVGAVSKVYIEENGQEMVMQETINAIEANKHLAMTFSMDFMNMDYEINFEEQDGQTLIKTKSKTVGNGIISKSIVSFMGNSMKRQEDQNLIKLKTAIEESTKDYFPLPAIDSKEVVEDIIE